eukprot:gene7029-7093_t
MDDLAFNKIAGAVLGTLLFVMGLGIVSNGIFSHEKSSKAGYELAAGEAPGKAEAVAPAAAEEPLPVLLAKADAAKGEASAKACAACHSFEKGGAAKVGPPLYAVVSRAKGSIAGFAYSEGMKAKGGNWGYDELNAFITNPKAYVSGTKMGYAGEKDGAKRANILAYLKTLSDAPVDFPK